MTSPSKFAVYALAQNLPATHVLRFLGTIDAESHEDAVERAVDALIEESTRDMPRHSRAKGDGWSLLKCEAAVAFPVDSLWQIDSPDHRGVKLGHFTSASSPRRMRVRP